MADDPVTAFALVPRWIAVTAPDTGGSPWINPLLVLLGIVATAVATYLVARRTSSGRIDTTEAAKLWDESNSMRQELRDETVSLREELGKLYGKFDLLTEQNNELREAHRKCQRNEAQLRRRVSALERAKGKTTTKKATPRKKAR